MNPVIAALDAAGNKAEGAALRAVATAYGNVSLADLVALVQLDLDKVSPRVRLAQLGRLMDTFDAAAAGIGTPPAALLSQAEGVILANVTAAADMLGSGALIDAFRVPPKLQLEWAETTAERMKLYWLTENERFRGEVQGTLVEGLTRGQGTDQVARNLQGRLGVSRSRANLIARNELGNCAGYAMQESQKLAGVTHYIWQATSDSRTRPEHAARDGEVFAWDEPPYDGNPGFPVQCRCVALAKLD